MKQFIIALLILVGCGNMSPAGDITAVSTPAGSGLTGGATAGSASLSLLTTCSSTQVLKWNGSAWACGAAGITNSASSNVVTKSDGTNVVASTISDDGTIVAVATNKFTVATATGNVGIGASPGTAPLEFAQSTGQKIAFYPVDANRAYGVGVSASLLKFYVPNAGDVLSFGSGISGSFTGTVDITTGTGVGVTGTLTTTGNQTTNGGALRDTGTVASSFSAGCGTGPSATGGRWAFTATIGTSPGTSCQVTFSTAFSATPTCHVQGINKSTAVMQSRSTTSITFTVGGPAFGGGDQFDIICIGH